MIEEHKFGSFVVDGRNFLGDIKIINNRVHYWEDRVKHTVSFGNIKDILESGPEVIVIGTGNSGYLEVPSEVRDMILGKRITLFIDINTEAVKRFNKAASENKNVAGLFHATC